ncbi:hypothetical protein BXT84_00510 [Sulfobacillus thermotolerans]|uniref:Flp pilus-assembly TadG-like N-terminal domain-containing protein n=1 Tax=Sulfobacillus thermotolerans TaxID=338644 RepID=A0ABN5GVU7_9FIRM|nr:hypothetical protein BXT84_00510 [Sulfobacillus thermotolerans]
MRRGPGGRVRVLAAADTIGTVLGLVLVLMGVTGGIAGYRLWHVQQTLNRAASAAATSEAQNGCWTAQTSQIVAQVLQGGGLPISGANAVQVTHYSNPQGTTTPYGQMVTAQLHWAVPISVVRLQLPTTVPLSSAVVQPSQYVALGGNTAQSNGACTPPDLTVTAQTVAAANDDAAAATTNTAADTPTTTCTPTTVEVTKTVPQSESCTPETHTECSPVSHETWVDSTYEACGDTTQYEYTCREVNSCTPQSVCSTHYQTWCDLYNDGAYGSSPSHPVTHCVSVPISTCSTETVCSTHNVCGSSPVTTYSCHPVTTGHWQTETTQSCHDVTTTQCQTIAAHTEQVPETVEQCS